MPRRPEGVYLDPVRRCCYDLAEQQTPPDATWRAVVNAALEPERATA